MEFRSRSEIFTRTLHYWLESGRGFPCQRRSLRARWGRQISVCHSSGSSLRMNPSQGEGLCHRLDCQKCPISILLAELAQYHSRCLCLHTWQWCTAPLTWPFKSNICGRVPRIPQGQLPPDDKVSAKTINSPSFSSDKKCSVDSFLKKCFLLIWSAKLHHQPTSVLIKVISFE